MKPGDQFVLEFPPRTATDREDFLVAPANRDAVAWIDRWPDWRSLGLVLVGPAGAGKSHLAAVWRARTEAGLTDATELTLDNVATLATARPRWVIDHADRAAHRPLLHFYNLIREQQGSLLLTARTPPSAWAIPLADLASRLATLPVAAIDLPDDNLMQAVLIKLLVDRQLTIDTDVLAYLTPRLERSFDMMRRLAEALDRAALSGHRPITIPLARDVLTSL